MSPRFLRNGAAARWLSDEMTIRTVLPALFLLAACGSQEEAGNQAEAGKAGPAAPASAGLTGLYEGGTAGRPDQLCLVEDKEGSARFGMVVWGSDLHSCLGMGDAKREGARLTLTMAGDSSCRIEARIEGESILLPASVPEGCGYYCGARARFAERKLTRSGATAADARKARDLTGEPLC